MYNKQWLSETLAEKFETQNTLHVGQIIKIGDREEIEGARENKNRSRTGNVIALYKHYMLVQFKNSRESFSYIDIITSIVNYSDADKRKGEKLFNAKFGKEYKRITIEMIPFQINLAEEFKKRSGAKGDTRRTYHNWTTEQIKYIMKNKDVVIRNDLVKNFNIKFKTSLTKNQITSLVFREGGKLSES